MSVTEQAYELGRSEADHRARTTAMTASWARDRSQAMSAPQARSYWAGVADELRLAEVEAELAKYDPAVAHHDVPELVEERRLLKAGPAR